jgi:uncharacterized protein YndB with AHSA1/START domain
VDIQTTPAANVGMLIRRPAAEVFQAFVDPAITSKFWFTKGSGRLQPGAKVHWDWEMYGVSSQVEVKAIDTDRRILVDWGSVGERTTRVEWRFEPRGDSETFVSICNSGFSGTGDEIVSQALGSTQGFTLVVAGAKAFLEHGLELNLVPDRFPDTIVKAWSRMS